MTIAELLKAEGYATAHFGKWHLGMPTAKYPDKPTPSDHGFDYWFATANNAGPSHRNPKNFVRNGKKVGELEGYSCDLVVSEAAGWLDRRSNKEVPFFLNVWFHEPHARSPHRPTSSSNTGDESDPAAVYSATVANTDRVIKRLLEKLRDVVEPDNTIIIYPSDNGSYRSDRVGDLRGIKGSNYEGGIRVPGVFHWPGHIAAGAVTGEPAGLVDLVPTVCGLIGIQPPQVHLDGTDLSDLLTGKSKKVAREISRCSGVSHLAVRPSQFVTDATRWLLIARVKFPKISRRLLRSKRGLKRHCGPRGFLRRKHGEAPSKDDFSKGFLDREAETLRGQFIQLNQFHESWIPAIKQSKFTRFELYDLVEDPSQQQDLSVRLPQVHYRLKSKLQQLASEALQEAFDWSTSEAALRGKGSSPRLTFIASNPCFAHLLTHFYMSIGFRPRPSQMKLMATWPAAFWVGWQTRRKDSDQASAENESPGIRGSRSRSVAKVVKTFGPDK